MRDQAFERDFVEGAEKRANHTGFAEHVHFRLQEGERMYGSAFFAFPIAKKIREIREEAFDVAAYCTLFAQDPEVEGSLADGTQIRMILQEMAAHAVKIDQLADALKDALV